MKRPQSSYFICANPRSGSWLLAAGLQDTGKVGHPNEWFNEPEVKMQCLNWGIPYPIANFETYLERVLLAGAAGTDIFGVKCLAENFMELGGYLATIQKLQKLPMHKALAAVFPDIHYIRLNRRDLTRQAISYYRAAKSQVWFSVEGVPDPPGNYVEFDAEEILRHEQILLDHEAMWDSFFSKVRVKPYTVYYENLANDYFGTVKGVLEYLGLDSSVVRLLPKSRFRKQADAVTEDWVKRYNVFKGG